MSSINFTSAPLHSATETTAAQATAQAPNLHVAQEIQRNAEIEQAAANEAARVAKTSTLAAEVSTDQTVAAHEAMLAAERQTLSAVEQGKHDVDHAKTAVSGYVDTAKEYVHTAIETAQHYIPTAIETAQNYLPTAMGGKPADPNSTSRSVNTSTGPGITTTVKETAASAYTTAVETVQPVVNKVVSSAEGALGAAGLQGKAVADRTHDTTTSTLPTHSQTTGLGAKDTALTAPLQSGDKVIKGPYAEGVASHEIGTNAPVTHN